MYGELTRLMAALEQDFSSFRKELNAFKYVVDISSLDTSTINKLQTKFNSEYYKEQGFIILKTSAQFNKVKDMLAAPVSTSQEAVESFVIAKSSEARNRLAATIAAKTKDLAKYSSPEFTATITDNIEKRLNRYRITFSLNSDDPVRLKKLLISTATKSIRREIKSARKGTIFREMLDARERSIAHTFRTGKTLKNTKRKTVKRKSKVSKTASKKQYYAPLQTATGLFTNALSLRNTLNVLLHDTIQNNHMKPSSAPPNKNYLRYQTGRFAKSAIVENTSYSGGVLSIDFDYMENPYSVFKEGGNGIGRNPEVIIERAIRDIMAQHIHAKFSAIIRKV